MAVERTRGKGWTIPDESEVPEHRHSEGLDGCLWSCFVFVWLFLLTVAVLVLASLSPNPERFWETYFKTLRSMVGA